MRLTVRIEEECTAICIPYPYFIVRFLFLFGRLVVVYLSMHNRVYDSACFTNSKRLGGLLTGFVIVQVRGETARE